MSNKNDMQHTHKVTIGGDIFQIRSDQPPSVIENISQYVNTQMSEVGKSQMRGDNSRIAILAAMNIAGELMNVKKQLEEYKLKYEHIEDRAKMLHQSLNDISNQTEKNSETP